MNDLLEISEAINFLYSNLNSFLSSIALKLASIVVQTSNNSELIWID
jgi:hypothetical protein